MKFKSIPNACVYENTIYAVVLHRGDATGSAEVNSFQTCKQNTHLIRRLSEGKGLLAPWLPPPSCLGITASKCLRMGSRAGIHLQALQTPSFVSSFTSTNMKKHLPELSQASSRTWLGKNRSTGIFTPDGASATDDSHAPCSASHAGPQAPAPCVWDPSPGAPGGGRFLLLAAGPASWPAAPATPHPYRVRFLAGQ